MENIMGNTKNTTATKKSRKISYAQKVKSINANRVHGDLALVAKATSYDPGHVCHVLKGRKRNETIVNEAYEMIRARKGK
jgi:hypothetical protein